MSKKKPVKKQEFTDKDLRKACGEIVSELYAEVERVNMPLLEAFNARLAAVEAAIAQPEPKTWIGRLHRRRWFCLPWCRGRR